MVACSPVAAAGWGVAVRVLGASKLVVGAVGEVGRIGSGVDGVVLPVPGVFGFHMGSWCSFRADLGSRDGLAEGAHAVVRISVGNLTRVRPREKLPDAEISTHLGQNQRGYGEDAFAFEFGPA